MQCANCAPNQVGHKPVAGEIAHWHSADGIKWFERSGWQPKPGRLDNQEVIFWDE